MKNVQRASGVPLALFLVLLIVVSILGFNVGQYGDPDTYIGQSSAVKNYNYNPYGSNQLDRTRFLKAVEDSKAAYVAEAGAMFDHCVSMGCNAAAMFAFAEIESSHGKSDIALNTKSPFNIRYLANNGFGNTSYKGFTKYTNYTDSTRHWVALIMNYHRRGLTTFEQVIETYAPVADGNDVNAYKTKYVAIINRLMK